MASVVSVQQIPTLRELYRRGVIAARPQATSDATVGVNLSASSTGESANDGGGGTSGGDREASFTISSSLLDRVSVYRGDITHVQVDAIVNAANSRLLGGGGVDGAIHRAAGPDLLKECRTLGGCPVGEARLTAGYNLPAKHVIHAVGPIYRPDNTLAPVQLAGCYRHGLQLAAEHGLKHIAFPAISTGIYRYPIDSATQIALRETIKFLDTEGAKKFERVIFVVFSSEDEAVYLGLIPDYFPWDGPAPLSPSLTTQGN